MIRETAGENALELAAKRLDRALSALEQRLQSAARRVDDPSDLFDRSKAEGDLAAELERAQARERDLEAAGAEASAALGRAISEIRAALDGAQSAEG